MLLHDADKALNLGIPPLQVNDRIALFCPGNICLSNDHPEQAKAYLEQNYQLKAEFNIDTTERLSPKARAHYFLEHLFNPDIRLLAALRGGEGSADILPYLHSYYHEIKALKPKWLLGFSDVTALLVYFAEHYQWPVIHGSHLLQFALKGVDVSSEMMTMQLLFGKPFRVALSQLMPLNHSARKQTILNGSLMGGCLSVIDVSIKDIWEPNFANKIIFFEDCGEKAHKILRTLKYFSRIKLFDQAKAIILGDMTCYPVGVTSQEQLSHQEAIIKALTSFAQHHDLPVLYTTQLGHGRTNWPLVYQTEYQLNLGLNPQLILKGV